jgi:hypothetical protein
MTDPYMDAGMKGWIVNTARKNHWRVASYYELEDLISDGMLCYYKCRARYKGLHSLNHPGKDQRRHVMALVKTAFHNHITTLALKRSRLKETACSQAFGPDHDGVMEAILPAQHEEATVRTMLTNAPQEIKALIDVITKDGVEVAGYVYKKVGRLNIRETTDDYFGRLLAQVGYTPAGLRKLVELLAPDTPARELNYLRVDGVRETSEDYCNRLISVLTASGITGGLTAYFVGT